MTYSTPETLAIDVPRPLAFTPVPRATLLERRAALIVVGAVEARLRHIPPPAATQAPAGRLR